jgi:hypothetical protein
MIVEIVLVYLVSAAFGCWLLEQDVPPKYADDLGLAVFSFLLSMYCFPIKLVYMVFDIIFGNFSKKGKRDE